MIEERNDKKIKLKIMIDELVECGSGFLEYQAFGITLLSNLSEVFNKSDANQKSAILGSIFQGGLIFENGYYRTTKTNEAVEYLWRFQKGMDENGAGRVSLSDNSPCMAPRQTRGFYQAFVRNSSSFHQ